MTMGTLQHRTTRETTQTRVTVSMLMQQGAKAQPHLYQRMRRPHFFDSLQLTRVSAESEVMILIFSWSKSQARQITP